MSKWDSEKIKKRGLNSFTRAKFEYALGNSPTVEKLMEIAQQYANQRIAKVIKESKQKGLFEVG